jgi:hypothetical protein
VKEPATASDYIAIALLTAAESGDDDGLALLCQISVNNFGTKWTGRVLQELPLICNPPAVPIVLQTLHQHGWVSVAREIVLQAISELTKSGVATPGKDISFSSDFDGVPTLHMALPAYREATQIKGHSMQLLTAFLRVE